MSDSAPAGVIVAAPASGSGKTVFTLGLVRHLARSGVKVATAKAGPDYIDPAYHAAASGRPCFNIDSWAMRPATLGLIRSRLAGSDIAVCEGVMGLFDGASGGGGSTADIAEATGWPVVLVIDARAQGASVGALLHGFAIHRPGIRIAGAVFNRVGSDNHARILADAAREAVPEVTLLGAIPRDDALVLPERHLGLVQAGEIDGIEAFLERAADAVAGALDIDGLRALAAPWPNDSGPSRNTPVLPPLGSRIAVADDAAFAFRYPLVIDGWRAAGAEIVPFSPLADQTPDPNADAVYLPGGYPELHAGRIAQAETFLRGLRTAGWNGTTIYGECGGYMVLGTGLVDADGRRHAMGGLLPLETSFAERRLHLGYRRARLAADGPLGKAGCDFRGHEFHYAAILDEGSEAALFDLTDSTGQSLGPAGLRAGSVMGSFVHLIDGENDV